MTTTSATDLTLASATDQLAALDRGTISSRELVEGHLDRIERLDGRVNAVVACDPDGARAAADASDRVRAAGEPVGPLHGLPMTIKDVHLTRGLPTTYGSRTQRGPDVDDVPVARLRAAGAVFLGKTNTPPFAQDIQTYNRTFGTTTNPWDATRTSGGSSGGAAAAVAVGMTALELGNDLGGSIRLPSAYCGVYGHKSSYGLVPAPTHPLANPRHGAPVDMAVTGPIARSAEDLDLMLGIIAGANPDASHAIHVELPEPRARRVEDFRVGVWLSDPACPTEPDVLERLEGAVDAIRATGAKVSVARPDLDLKRAFATYQQLLYAGISNGIPTKFVLPLLVPSALHDPVGTAVIMGSLMAVSAQVRRAILGGNMSHRRWIRVDEARQELQRAWQRYFEEYDVLLTPASPVVAPRHNHRWGSMIIFRTIEGGRWRRRYVDQMVWAGVIGMAYLPSTVAPVGLSRAVCPSACRSSGRTWRTGRP